MRKFKAIAKILIFLAIIWVLCVKGINGVTLGSLISKPISGVINNVADTGEEFLSEHTDEYGEFVFPEDTPSIEDVETKTEEKTEDVIADAQQFLNDAREALGTDVTTSDSNLANVYVEFIDVGQGDSTLIVDNGQAMLIDTGLYEAYDNVKDTLREYGVSTIDVLILTHPDADHIQAAPAIIEDYDVETCYMPVVTNDTAAYERAINSLYTNNVEVINPTAGDLIDFGTAKYEVLGPVYDIEGAYDDTNSYSIIVKMTNGADSFLFTGDATGDETEDVLSTGMDVSADVYKASHHGSANDGCNSEAFIRAVSPETMVVSCGYHNDHGHPHRETMSLATEYGLTLYRTDLQGSVGALSTGNGIKWSVEPTTVYTNGNNL